MLEAIVISVTLVLFFGLMFFGTTGAKKRRKVEVARLVEPLGFEIINKVDEQSLAHFYQHRSMLGFWNVQAICVADSGSKRIVVIEYHVTKQHFVQYFLGIGAKMSAPRLVIKKRTASTRSFLTASWGDVLFQVRFPEDPEFDEKFIVRGDPDQVRVFLNPLRRKALCESTQVPIQFSVCSKSLFIEFPDRITSNMFEQNLSQCLAMIKILAGDGKVAAS
jgi:hypothetical protein